MGLFTYSKKQSDKIIARAFIDFLGGSKAMSDAIQSNVGTLRFLKEKHFFNDEGLGSIEALNESSKIELAALFRSGVKYNDFNDFFTFASRFNPLFSSGKDFGKVYLDRYNDVFDKAFIYERERKNQPVPEFSDEDRVSVINRKEILESFKTPLISEGVMGSVLKGNYGTTTKEAVALLASASKVLDFYHENDKSVEHYHKIIQACMFEDNYEMVEKMIGVDPLKKPSSRTRKEGNDYEFISAIFDGVVPEKEKSPFFKAKSAKTEILKEPKIVQVKEKLEGKIIKDSILAELKEMGVNVTALQRTLTKDNVVKFYLANKNKASIEDIKDVIIAEESVKSLVLEPIFNFFLGTKGSKKFDPELLSLSQMKLLHNLSNFEENDISVVINRVKNHSQIVKNLFERTLTNSKSDEKIKKEILNSIISSRVLAKDDYRDFVSELTSVFFEPKIKKLISSQSKLQINMPQGSTKTYAPGFVKVSGEVLFIENLPISLTKNKNTNKYEKAKLDFSKADLEKFKNELWTEYGCDAQALDLEKDTYLGNNKYLLEIANISKENAAEMMSRINNSDRTKEFMTSKRVFSDNELEEICGQVKVKNADYSIFKSEAFYKNAKQAALDKALKSFYQQQAEKENSHKQAKESQANQAKLANAQSQTEPVNSQSATQEEATQEEATQEKAKEDSSKTSNQKPTISSEKVQEQSQTEREQEEFEKEENQLQTESPNGDESKEPKQLNFSFIDIDSLFDPSKEQSQQEEPTATKSKPKSKRSPSTTKKVTEEKSSEKVEPAKPSIEDEKIDENANQIANENNEENLNENNLLEKQPSLEGWGSLEAKSPQSLNLDSIKRSISASIYSNQNLNQFEKNEKYDDLGNINSPEELKEYVDAVAPYLAFDSNLLRNIQTYLAENELSAENLENSGENFEPTNL